MKTFRRHIRDFEIAARRRLGLEDHATIFETVYRKNIWKVGSGPGSTAENTGPYRAFLADFIKSRGIASVVDVGCGDWQSSRLIDWSGVSYTGTDVSETAISRARLHQSDTVSFQVLNAVSAPLPGADLLIAKDVLQHWSNQDILDFYPKLRGFRFALITNGFPPKKLKYINHNIRSGKGRPIDLAIAPFQWPGRYIFDYDGDEPKRVYLWSR